MVFLPKKGRNSKKLLVILAVAVIALLTGSNLSSIITYTNKALGIVSHSASQPKIQHIIFLINENHGFDNFFGTYPNVPQNMSLNLNVCIPDSLSMPSGPCEKPFYAGNMPQIQETDQCHTELCAVPDDNNGSMNGFVEYDTNRTMAYYNGSALPETWDLAQYFDLDYNFYSSAISYSEPNHEFTVAANSNAYTFFHTSSPATAQAFVNLTFPEIGSELTQNGISWGDYQYAWNDKLDCTGSYKAPSDYWGGEENFRAVQNTVIECSSLGNITDFLHVLSTNTLPAVSWVIPEPSESGHPGSGTLQANEQFITSIVDDIEQSPEWNSSVTFVTWDDYGGYYDNVAPTWLDQYGDGFRVPLIAVSPYTIQGLVGGSPYFNYYDNFTRVSGLTNREDFSAFLSTIEQQWNLKNLTNTDGEEPSLFYMLNFSQKPLPPLYFNPDYSLSVYPLSFCYADNGCNIGTPYSGIVASPVWIMGPSVRTDGTSTARVYTVYNAPTPSWAENSSLAAYYAGNGDPDD